MTISNYYIVIHHNMSHIIVYHHAECIYSRMQIKVMQYYFLQYLSKTHTHTRVYVYIYIIIYIYIYIYMIKQILQCWVG